MGSMWPLSIFGCFGPILGLLLLAECCRVLWISLVRPSRPREAECGKCGYAIAGLTQPKCPECGADLTIVGVNTAMLALRHRGSTFGALLAWTALAACVGLVSVTFVGIFAYRYSTAVAASASNQVWTTQLFPKSGAYSQVLYTSSVSWGAPSSTQLTLELTRKDATTCTLRYDSTTGKYSIVDPAGSASPDAPLTSGSTTAFFKAAELDLNDTAIAAEAQELDTVLKVVSMSPYTMPSQLNLNAFAAASTNFSQAGTTTAARQSGWTNEALPVLAVGAVAFLVWMVGIVLIVLRRRRLLSGDTAHSPGM